MPLRGHLAMSGDLLSCHNLQGGMLWMGVRALCHGIQHLVVEARDAATPLMKSVVLRLRNAALKQETRQGSVLSLFLFSAILKNLESKIKQEKKRCEDWNGKKCLLLADDMTEHLKIIFRN